MKAKTIRKVLRAKFDKLLESITDPTVKELMAKNTIITGGSIASMLLREEVNDFDLYFRDHATTLAVAHYYVNQFNAANPMQPVAEGVQPVRAEVTDIDDHVRVKVKSAGIIAEGVTDKKYNYFESRPPDEAGEYVDQATQALLGGLDDIPASTLDEVKPTYRVVFMSANALTLSSKVQIILRFYGEPEEIHKNYDFLHCTNYWKSWGNELVLSAAALEALLAKELRYVGSKYPLCSIIRTRKFVARGWTINAGQFVKMAMQLNELDLKNLTVLEDQLTGVDAAYFCQLISELKSAEPEKINALYISTIIDRLF